MSAKASSRIVMLFRRLLAMRYGCEPEDVRIGIHSWEWRKVFGEFRKYYGEPFDTRIYQPWLKISGGFDRFMAAKDFYLSPPPRRVVNAPGFWEWDSECLTERMAPTSKKGKRQ